MELYICTLIINFHKVSVKYKFVSDDCKCFSYILSTLIFRYVTQDIIFGTVIKLYSHAFFSQR